MRVGGEIPELPPEMGSTLGPDMDGRVLAACAQEALGNRTPQAPMYALAYAVLRFVQEMGKAAKTEQELVARAVAESATPAGSGAQGGWSGLPRDEWTGPR